MDYGEIDVEQIPIDQIPDAQGNKNERSYSREAKIHAAFVYITAGHGQFTTTAKIEGMDDELLLKWIRSGWWQIALAAARKLYGDEAKAYFSSIAMRAAEQLEDRIVNGNITVTHKKGERIERRTPLVANQLANIMAVAFDKHQLASGAPTAIRRTMSNEDHAKKLAERAKATGSPAEPVTGGANVIPGNFKKQLLQNGGG